MKFKKLIMLALVSAISLPYMNVQADEEYVALFNINQEQNVNGRLISVVIKGHDVNSEVDTLVVLPEKVNGADVLSDGVISDAEMAKSIHADENHLKTPNKVYKFYMPDSAPYGVYTIVAGGSTPAGKLINRYHKFYYGASVGDSNTYIQGTTLTATNLEAGLASGYFYIDTNNAAYAANKNAVAKIVDNLNPQTQFELEEAFRLACDFVDSANMDLKKLDAYMTVRASDLNLNTLNADYVKYPDNTKRIFKAILDNASGADEVISLEDLRHTFIEACAVSAIDKETDSLTIIQKLKEYNNDVFKLNFDSADYKKVYPYDVGKEFVNNSYDSVGAIVSAFNSRVTYLAQNANNPLSPSDGGGGGGGGGFAATTPIETDKFNELTDNLPVFTDVPRSHWASVYIEFCYKNNIMTGDGFGSFRPDDFITRKEFVKTILSSFAVDATDASCDFADVSKTDWAYPYISKAYVMGVANGISEEEYGPEMNITRQDAVTMIYRIAAMAREGYAFNSEDVSGFTDKESIASYAQDAINVMSNANVIGGYEDGSFKPDKTITRAETAKIIKALLDVVG